MQGGRRLRRRHRSQGEALSPEGGAQALTQVILFTTHGLTLVFEEVGTFTTGKRFTIKRCDSITFIKAGETKTLDLRQNQPSEFSIPASQVARAILQ